MCSRRRSSRPSCSTSSPWLRPSSERSSGSSPSAGSDALRRSRQLPLGRRRWASFGERRSSRAMREATSFADAGRSRRMRRCAPSPATCWSLATLSNVGAVCARRAWGVGRARGHVSLCWLVIMFVITTGPVGPVRPQGPKRPAATVRSGAKSGPTAMLTRSRTVETS